MKKLLSTLLVMSLICAGFLVGNAENRTIEPIKNVGMFDRLYSKQCTLFNRAGEDITSDFYKATTASYLAKNYEAVLAYLKQHVYYAECFEEVPPMNRDSLVSIQDDCNADNLEVRAIEWWFLKHVDDENHGYSNHNIIEGDAYLEYTVNTTTDLIVSAKKPVITRVELVYPYGDLLPDITVTNRRAQVFGGGTHASFLFHVHADYLVYSYIYPDVNDLQITYSYNADFEYTVHAGTQKGARV